MPQTRPSTFALPPLSVAVALLLAAPWPAAAQEGGAGGQQGPVQIGSFVYAEQGGRSLLVAPDTGSTLNEGTRIFFRCSDDQREVYVVSTEDRLGNAKEGSAGRYRFDGGVWSELSQWGSNESGSAAFLPPRFSRNFAARARKADRVEMEVVNTAGVRHRYVFSLAEFARGAERLACFRRGDGDG
jgi:hypothetical protein